MNNEKSELRIKEILKQKQITSIELAYNLDVNINTIYSISNGETIPSDDLLHKIAKALKVPLKKLYKGYKSEKVIGYLEFEGEVYKIKNKKDVYDALEHIDSVGTKTIA